MAAREELEDFAVVWVNGHHRDYVGAGAITDGTPGMRLGDLLMVFDCEGWATLHRVDGFKYARVRGKRTRRVMFGPRIPWVDGSVAARRLPDPVPEVADESEAKAVLREVM